MTWLRNNPVYDRLRSTALARRVVSRIKQSKYERMDAITLSFDDISVEFDTTHRTAKDWFFPRYAGERIHEPVVIREIADSMDSKSVFFDVGANLGYYALMIAKLQSPENVHAFEMDPHLVDIMANNLSRNDAQNLNLNCFPLSSTSGRVVTFAPHQSENPSTNMVTEFERRPTDRTISLVTYTLDEYAVEVGESPDVLKIDVEGHEGHVLEGAVRTISDGRPDLFLEVHPDLIDGSDFDLGYIESFLRDRDYSWRVLDHRSGGVRQDYDSVSLDEALESNTMLQCVV